MKLKKYECTQCGGNINPVTMICEYCGSRFESDYEGKPIFISKFEPKMDVLQAEVFIPNESVFYMGAKEASEVAMKDLVNTITRSLTQYLDVMIEDDLRLNGSRLRGKLRLIRPDMRFHDSVGIVSDHIGRGRY